MIYPNIDESNIERLQQWLLWAPCWWSPIHVGAFNLLYRTASTSEHWLQNRDVYVKLDVVVISIPHFSTLVDFLVLNVITIMLLYSLVGSLCLFHHIKAEIGPQILDIVRSNAQLSTLASIIAKTGNGVANPGMANWSQNYSTVPRIILTSNKTLNNTSTNMATTKRLCLWRPPMK